MPYGSKYPSYSDGATAERRQLARLLTEKREKNDSSEYRRACDEIASAVGLVREETVSYRV